MAAVDTKICYIVGAAEFCRGFLPEEGDLVIAADGGYDRLLQMGIEPQIVMGDLDSVRSSIPDSTELLRFKVEKDETDTYLAFLEGYRRGYRSFRILGGCGGRADHTMANYQLLLKARRMGARASLVSDYDESLVIENEAIVLDRGEYQGVSLFAFGKNARNVNISGLKYPANGIDLSVDFPLGVSNSFVENEAAISVEDGALLVMLRYKK